jgi:hypothetical protein
MRKAGQAAKIKSAGKTPALRKRVTTMYRKNFPIAAMGLAMAAAVSTLAAPALRGQSCTSSQDAAVQCFVHTALKTNLTSLRYGMTVPQFQAYGVAISKILQAQQTYLVLAGMSSAVADAMPPANADGSANLAAQQAASTSIVAAEIASGIVALPAETTQQQLVWFTWDLTNAMNRPDAILITPGMLLRTIDTYVVNATTSGVVNWTQVNANLANLVTSLQNASILKLPANITAAQVVAFAQSLAQIIYTYKATTGRATL